MSPSKTSPASIKGGIALSAEARKKLQQLADWLELENTSNQDPRVRLSYLGGIVLNERSDITSISAFGALVQMFQPFKKDDAYELGLYGLFRIPGDAIRLRVGEVLGITEDEVFLLQAYLYARGVKYPTIIEALRALK